MYTLQPKKVSVLGGYIFIGIVVIACLISLNPRILEVRKNLQIEYATLPKMPNAIEENVEASNKINTAMVNSYFRDEKTYDEIKAFYNRELIKLGWVFEDEHGVEVWGNNLGGKVIKFKKNNETIDIEYAGERANNGWVYAVALSWGE